MQGDYANCHQLSDTLTLIMDYFCACDLGLLGDIHE